MSRGLRKPLGGHFGLSGGPWGSWAPPGLPLGRSWPLLGRPGRPRGLLLAALGPLLGRPWPAPGPFWAARGSSWGSFGRSWAALGSQRRLSTKPLKTYIFLRKINVFSLLGVLPGPPGGLLGASEAVLGALGWLSGRPKWSSVELRSFRAPVPILCIDII